MLIFCKFFKWTIIFKKIFTFAVTFVRNIRHTCEIQNETLTHKNNKDMKKIALTLIAATICIAASAQVQDEVGMLRDELDYYRDQINEKVYSLVDIGDAGDREDVVDDIEDIFDDIEEYLNKKLGKIAPSSKLHKTITVDDFYCTQTPTTVSIKYGDFSFFSTPVTYEYHDGELEIRTTPTTQRVSTPAFLYESSPTRSTFKVWGDRPAGDTVSVRESDKFRFSTSVTADNPDNSNWQYDSTQHKYYMVKHTRNGMRAWYVDDTTKFGNGRGNAHYNFSFSRDRRRRGLNTDAKGMNYWYIGFCNFLNDDDEIDNPEESFMELNSSRSIELGFYTTIHRWTLNRFMAMDLGFDYRLRHYSFEHSFRLVKDNGVITADYTMPEGVKEYKRHNLRQQYISIPFTMEFRLGRRDNPLILSAGLEGSIRIASREKQVYKLDDERKVERHRSDFETNFLRYATTFGVGYRRFELYTNYSMVGLFKENRGPELYPFSIGVRFVMDKY